MVQPTEAQICIELENWMDSQDKKIETLSKQMKDLSRTMKELLNEMPQSIEKMIQQSQESQGKQHQQEVESELCHWPTTDVDVSSGDQPQQYTPFVTQPRILADLRGKHTKFSDQVDKFKFGNPRAPFSSSDFNEEEHDAMEIVTQRSQIALAYPAATAIAIATREENPSVKGNTSNSVAGSNLIFRFGPCGLPRLPYHFVHSIGPDSQSSQSPQFDITLLQSLLKPYEAPKLSVISNLIVTSHLIHQEGEDRHLKRFSFGASYYPQFKSFQGESRILLLAKITSGLVSSCSQEQNPQKNIMFYDTGWVPKRLEKQVFISSSQQYGGFVLDFHCNHFGPTAQFQNYKALFGLIIQVNSFTQRTIQKLRIKIDMEQESEWIVSLNILIHEDLVFAAKHQLQSIDEDMNNWFYGCQFLQRCKCQKLSVEFSLTTRQGEEMFGASYWRAGGVCRGTPLSRVTTTQLITNKVDSGNRFQKLINLPEINVIEVVLEIIEIKN